MGIVAVAALAAAAEVSPPTVTMTATWRQTRSAASAGTRSYWPSAQRNENGHGLAYEVGGKSRQSVVLTQPPAVLDRHVLTLDEACFAQATSECLHQMRGILRRPGTEIADHAFGVRYKTVAHQRRDRQGRERRAANGGEPHEALRRARPS
jgi:hypothetical protein